MNHTAARDRKRFLLFAGLLILIAQIVLFVALAQPPITPIAAIANSAQALSEDDIIQLATIAGEVRGTVKVGAQLGELNLPNAVLEDAFLRIAIYQHKLDRETAAAMFLRLSGVPGFRATIRKIIGNNAAVTAGHLNEMRIADDAVAHGFTVLGMGTQFNDGLKKARTDIDLILEKHGKQFVIEAKNYSMTTKIPADKFRADLNTLIVYKEKSDAPVIPICTLTSTNATELFKHVAIGSG